MIGTALGVVVLWFSLIKPLIPFAKEVYVVAILVLLLLIFVTVDDWTS